MVARRILSFITGATRDAFFLSTVFLSQSLLPLLLLLLLLLGRAHAAAAERVKCGFGGRDRYRLQLHDDVGLAVVVRGRAAERCTGARHRSARSTPPGPPPRAALAQVGRQRRRGAAAGGRRLRASVDESSRPRAAGAPRVAAWPLRASTRALGSSLWRPPVGWQRFRPWRGGPRDANIAPSAART